MPPPLPPTIRLAALCPLPLLAAILMESNRTYFAIVERDMDLLLPSEQK